MKPTRDVIWMAIGAVLFCVSVGLFMSRYDNLLAMRQLIFPADGSSMYTKSVVYVSYKEDQGGPEYAYEQVVGELLTAELSYTVQIGGSIYTPENWNLGMLKNIAMYPADQRFTRQALYDIDGNLYMVIYMPVRPQTGVEV